MLNILPRAPEEVNMLQKTKKTKSVQGKIRENTLKVWLKKRREQLTENSVQYYQTIEWQI